MLQADVITLTPKQSNIYSHGWHPHARHRVAVCGRRFGKTELACREIKRAVKLAAKRRINTNNEIWYACPTLKQAKMVFWTRLKRVIPRAWLVGKPNETECSMRLKTGHVIRIVGVDNVDNLRGAGLYFFVGDEWQDVKQEVWTQAISPMLATCKGHSLFMGTPKGYNTFYDYYVRGTAGGMDGWKSFHYTSIQGGNIDEEEIQTKRRELDPREFRQEYEGSFENYSGRVLYSFERIHNVKPCSYDATKDIHIGLDFNVNPMTATVWQETKEGAETISRQVAEIIIPTSNTDEMCDEITARYARKGSDGRNNVVSHIRIYPDASGAANRTSAQGRTDIGILRSRGYDVVALSSNPLVRDRFNTSNGRFCNALGERRAFVDQSCRKSIECYEKLVFKEGTSEPDKSEGWDHACDATGYYFFGQFGGSKIQRVKVNF